MPKISDLNSTNFPLLDFWFPASHGGETNKLSLHQVRSLMLFKADEIAYNATNVASALVNLETNKANQSEVIANYTELSTSLTNLNTATALALDLKYDKPTGGASDYIRGNGVISPLTKASVGLGLVDNTSDADKPVSTAQQTALNTKASYNWIINGNFTINQRGGVKKPANGVYGFDRWKGHANGIEQIVEALTAGEYTLTWTGGGNGTFGGQTKASPIKVTVAAGNTSVVVPQNATMVSVVLGDTTAADPWKTVARSIAVELNICERYYQRIRTRAWMQSGNYPFGYTIVYPSSMRVTPSVNTVSQQASGGANLRVEQAAINRLDVLIDGNNTGNIYWDATYGLDAEL